MDLKKLIPASETSRIALASLLTINIAAKKRTTIAHAELGTIILGTDSAKELLDLLEPRKTITVEPPRAPKTTAATKKPRKSAKKA